MDKYLLQILKETNTIIIPGLGALTITDHSTGEIMFMPYLKHDDGALANYIAEREGMDPNDAKNLVSKYVREIRQKLEQGDSYDMYRFGSFVKDASGEVSFKNWEETNGNSEASDETVVVTETPVMETPSQDEPTAQPSEPVREPEKEESEEIVPDSTSRPNTADAEIAGNRLEEEREAIERVKETEKEDKAEASAVPPVPPKTPKPAPVPKKEKTPKAVRVPNEPAAKKRKRTAIWVFPILALVLVAIVIYGSLNYEQIKASLFGNDASTADTTKVAEEPTDTNSEVDSTAYENSPYEVIADTDSSDMNTDENGNVATGPVMQTTPETIRESPEESVKTSSAKPVVESANTPEEGKAYHVIGGAFMEKTNADRYADKLSSEGNPSVIVGRFDNLYLVSIRSFATAAEARSNLSTLQAISPKAWIFKWP